MTTTTDPNDPRLVRGIDNEPRPQNEVYLVLSDEERTKGFVRPLRVGYKHVGAPPPEHPLLDLTDEQKSRYDGLGFVKFEKFPEGVSATTGRYWTQDELDNAGGGCGGVTIMAQPIAETYARNPSFYGATYCSHCQKHLPVSEFVWLDNLSRVGS